MKKKVFLFGVFIILLTLVFPLAIAVENNTKIDKAYECLTEKVDGKCSSLSLEQQIFSLLAIKKCKNEIISDAQNEECWPSSDCNPKTTAQVIMALNKAGTSTDKAEEWLLRQNTTPSNIDWYLEIESSEETRCSITYSGSSHSVNIGADKKISSNVGNCLSLAWDDYWLRISPSCYNEEFEISCDKSFLTTLLFKEKTASIIHLSGETTSASADGTTKEKVDSFCFAKDVSCDYEASLWATLVLDYTGYDISSYLPYLITLADEPENAKYIPESFLYSLTDSSNFRTHLLTRQKSNKWWEESGDKFYDTALTLYAFQYEDFQEKTNAKEWLLEVQDSNGCWEGNIRNTAFILYSVWPKEILIDVDELDCEIDGNGYCMSSMSCLESEGTELEAYRSGCFGTNICCDKEKFLETCEEQGGEICNSNQNCIGGTIVSATDTDSGETCCADGFCEEPREELECESYGGICRAYECNEDEKESSDECSLSDTCCVKETVAPKSNYLWIWIFLILIILIIIGIIFRDKLRVYWFRIKSKFGKSKPSEGRGHRPGFPPAPSSRIPLRRATPRKVLPPTQRRPVRRAMPTKKAGAKPRGELDNVLKKLKEMGK